MEFKMQDSILLLPYNSVQVVRDFFSVPITGHQQDTAKDRANIYTNNIPHVMTLDTNK